MRNDDHSGCAYLFFISGLTLLALLAAGQLQAYVMPVVNALGNLVPLP